MTLFLFSYAFLCIPFLFCYLFFGRLLDDREQRNSESSLAQLLRTDQAVSRRYNDHGGGLLNPTQILGQSPRKSKCVLFLSHHRFIHCIYFIYFLY